MNIDWLGKYHGSSTVALNPSTTEEVSKILSYCTEHGIAVVPQGGNTSLVGGSVPVYDEVIVSLKRMNQIKQFDPVSGCVVAEAGTILQQLDEYVSERGFIVPLDLGAKGSCQIGGNISTNAGGLRLLRYGSLHGSVLGLEVVLANGQVISQLNGLRKDNTGYDIKQLFIGSEGTLGIVTAASILCPPRPKSVQVAFLAVKSFENIQKLYIEAKSSLGEILSAFEFMDNIALDTVCKVHQKDNPLDHNSQFYVLIETHGSNEEHDKDKLNKFLEKIMTDEVVEDGTIAQDETQVKALWAYRENIPESLNRVGKVYKYDVSLPLESMYELVEVIRERLAGIKGVSVIGYGHLGDSNLHLNITESAYSEATYSLIEPFVYEFTSSKGGSISAEHGLGQMKNQHIYYSKGKADVSLMREIKKVLDPMGILNPYKVLPE